MDSPRTARRRRLARAATQRLLACALAGPLAAAQLDLPAPPAGGGTARPGARPEQPAPELVLPAPLAGEPSSGGAAAPAAIDPLAPLELPRIGHVDLLRAEVRKLGDAGARLAFESAAILSGLGEEGLAAAREMLRDEHSATLVVGARALLASGAPADRQAVSLRLTEGVPAGSAAALLEALLELDPEWSAPERLVACLDSPQAAVRAAAHRLLQDRVGEPHLPHLAAALRSDRADTRERALELAAAAGGTGRRALLLGALGDASPRVARRAAELIAIAESPEACAEIGGALLAQWKDPGASARARAYSLLAAAELEDRRGVAVLADGDAPQLLSELDSASPLTSFAAAVALAGVGFRSRTPSASEWLDLEVPHLLVKAISGDTFHSDFSAVEVPARRRLELLSGQLLGADGMSWRRWWVGAAPAFRARRVWLETDASSFAELEVELRGAEGADLFRLLGPRLAEAAPAVEPEAALADTYVLSEVGARALFERLTELEVFGAARPPGTRGRAGAAQRTLAVRLEDQEKSFSLGPGAHEPWFDAAASAVIAARETCSWQRWPDPARHASRRALWLEERDWWAAEHSEPERRAREKGLVLAHLRGLSPAPEQDLARRRAVAELARMYAQPVATGTAGAADAADLPHILAAITAQPFHSGDVTVLTSLAIEAARAARSDGGPVSAPLGARIVEALHDRFRVDAGAEMAQVLAACEPAAALESSAHPSSYVRSAAARALGQQCTPEAILQLEQMLGDQSPAVEAAAVAALGAAGIEAARADILARAHESLPNVRIAALLAAAQLGGDGVLEELRGGLIESDQGVQAAAAEGLAILAEPSSAPILIDMLALGPRHPFFAHAREGLRRMGARAHTALLREAQSGPRTARREAALLLAEGCVADVAPELILLLSEDGEDAVLAEELAVLTCTDYRGEAEPAQLWWSWWDAAPRGDSLAWLCEAGAAVFPAPVSPRELSGAGSGRGARALVQLLGAGPPHLAERARRELSRLLGREIEGFPAEATARAAQTQSLLAEIEARYGR